MADGVMFVSNFKYSHFCLPVTVCNFNDKCYVGEPLEFSLKLFPAQFLAVSDFEFHKDRNKYMQ